MNSHLDFENQLPHAISHQMITDSIGHLVFAASSDRTLAYVNAPLSHFVGFRSDQLIGRDWLNLIHLEDRTATEQAWSQAKLSEKPLHIEHRLKNRDDQWKWHALTLTPNRISQNQKINWCGTWTDIDQYKQAIETMKSELTVRDTFVQMLTHDLRSPLTAAKMSLELLSRNTVRPGNLPPKKIIEQTSQYLERIDRMLQELLDANRLHARKKIPLLIEHFSLNTLIENTLECLARAYGHWSFEFKCSGEISGHWDPNGIRRIIENLCGNATKYGNIDSPITVSVRELRSAENDFVEISVHNHGAPLSTNEKELLFEIFHRTTAAQISGKQGWGIGLAIVRGLAEAHGGNARVESNFDTGTTFIVQILKDSRVMSS